VITLVGRSQDVSASGVSLLVAAHGEVRQGAAGRLTMNTGDDIWCEELPVRIVRVRHWLRASGRALEIGVQLETTDAVERQRWQECVARMGVEE
jgi:hypothetical protein